MRRGKTRTLEGIVSHSPYSPPNARVADQVADKPTRWGRAAWVHLPVFFGCVWVMVDLHADWLPEITPVNLALGVVLTALLLHGPMRKLITLDDSSAPWHWDVLLYSILVALVIAVLIEDVDAAIVAGVPTVLLNGIIGGTALAIERLRSVKIYVSARRYHFEPAADAL